MAKQEMQNQEAKSLERSPNQEEQGQQGVQRSRGASAPLQRGTHGTNPFAMSPFSLMRRFSEDVDRLFGGFFGPSLLSNDWPSDFAAKSFWPEIDVQHTGDKLLIQADVPGLKKEDVHVDVRDHELCISGERRSESDRNEGRFYRTERSYGSFYRTVTLPEGAKPETASATFDNGVLKIEMEAPGGGQGQSRRIEVREGSPH
jgi:HSP20 family protein